MSGMKFIRTFVLVGCGILVVSHAMAAKYSVSDAELAEMKAKIPAELAEVFVSGDIAHARVAAELLVRDWDTCSSNYDLLFGAMMKASDKMEEIRLSAEPEQFETVPGVDVLPRSLLILARMPAIIREAPLGSERNAVSDRFLSFLEKELANSASPLPRRHALQCLVWTVYSGGAIVPERNRERVIHQLLTLADDPDPSVRLITPRLLRAVAITQEREQRAQTLEFLKSRRKKEGVDPNLTPDLRKVMLDRLDRNIEVTEREVTGNTPWPIEVIGEREYRDMAEASTEDLLNDFLGRSRLKSHRAIWVLSQREDTQTRALALLESHPERFSDAVSAYSRPLPETATDAEKRRRDQMIDFLEATLSRPLPEGKHASWLGPEKSAVDSLGWMLNRETYAPEYRVKHEEVPRPYAKDRIVEILLKTLDHSDWGVRDDVAQCLKTAVKDDPTTAGKLIPELEKRAGKMAAQYGYGKESRDKESERVLKEFQQYPKEWQLYDSIMRTLDDARSTQKNALK